MKDPTAEWMFRCLVIKALAILLFALVPAKLRQEWEHDAVDGGYDLDH
jgi:hypothetical protein